MLLPRGPWGRIWLEVSIATLAVLVGIELFWRDQGHTPSVAANVALWSQQRDRLQGAGLDTVALVGSSRIQTGFVPEVFHEQHPDIETVQLALPGMGGFATLRDLAKEESFRGVVLCSMDARTLRPSKLEGQERFVKTYHSLWGPGEAVNTELSLMLQESLVLLRPPLRGEQLVAALWHGHLPRNDYVQTLRHRRWIADYSGIDLAQLTETRVNKLIDEVEQSPAASEEDWREIVGQLRGFVDEIEARGGRVAFLRFPISGRIQTLHDQHFPDELYWDVLKDGVDAVVIDSADMPGVNDLQLPDESHLDSLSAERFTRWLATELVARGVID